MSNEHDNNPTNEPSTDPNGGGRRQGDRRKTQAPFEGPDRRQGDRRSGTDRRSSPRSEAGMAEPDAE